MNNIVCRDEIGMTMLGVGVISSIEYWPYDWRLPTTKILREYEMY